MPDDPLMHMMSLMDPSAPSDTQAAPDAGSLPGDDEDVSPEADVTVLEAIRAFKREAKEARQSRDEKNTTNRAAYMCEGDYSDKDETQSREFLPKVSMAAEQFSAFIKRGMVGFGDWFAAETYEDPMNPQAALLTPGDVRSLMLRHMSRFDDDPPQRLDFATTVADGAKSASLTSMIILKITGEHVPIRQFSVEQVPQVVETPMGPMPVPMEELQAVERPVWRLRFDLIPPENYYPDPTGRGLYEIITSHPDLSDVIQMAEDGIYDMAAVDRIEEDFADAEADQLARERSGQDQATKPGFRKKVQIDEFWGTLLDSRGHVVARNVVAAVANDKYLIRRPEPNPFWHQSSPILAAPLIRVPFSTWHKAMYDHAVSLNFSANELFNLMLDGGLASVHGIKQVKADWLEDPDEISNGIPQGTTLKIKQEVPTGAKVLERIDAGEVPRDAMAMFGSVDHEFQLASLATDLKSGVIPRGGDVKATAIVEAEQQSSILFDGIIMDLENLFMVPALRKIWLTILQHANDWDMDDTVACIGPMAANMLGQMTPAQRFTQFAKGYKFKVTGLSGLASRTREFQKNMALGQSITMNPMLMQAFFQEYSAKKWLSHIMKVLNINPDNLRLSPEEQMAEQQRMMQLQQFQQMVQGSGANRGQGGGAGMSAPLTGETQLPAEINQITNPLTSL